MVKERKRLTKKQKIFCILGLMTALVITTVLYCAYPYLKVFGKVYIGDLSGVYGASMHYSGPTDFCLSNGKLLFTLPAGGDQPPKVICVDLSRTKLTESSFDNFFASSQDDFDWQRGYTAQKIRDENVAAWRGEFLIESYNGGMLSHMYWVLLQKDGTVFIVQGTTDYEPGIWDTNVNPDMMIAGRFGVSGSAAEFYEFCEKGYYQWDK